MSTYDAVFYGVALSQILLLSLFVPARVLRRTRRLVHAYPPSDFPKLYPVSVTTIGRALRVYLGLNVAVAALGVVLLAADWNAGYTIEGVGRIWEGEAYPFRNQRVVTLVWGSYTLLQYLVAIALFQFWEFRYFKRMRAARSRFRFAELTARRPFDFVPPTLVGVAAAAYVGSVVSLLLLESPQDMTTIALLTASNVCMAGYFFWLLYSKKHDPHQSLEDRVRMMRGISRVGLVISIVMSVKMASVAVLVTFKLFDYGVLLLSLYAQVVAVVATGRFSLVAPSDQTSFEGYKADPKTGAALVTGK